jgi:hypothetical protein
MAFLLYLSSAALQKGQEEPPVKTKKGRPALALLPCDRPELRAPSEDTVLPSDDDRVAAVDDDGCQREGGGT